MGQDYHYWPEYRGRGSLAKKIKRAMVDGLVKGDAIVFVENDDFYAADYLAWCAAGLTKYALYGEGRALYYNVQQRFWFVHSNLSHASLCSTAITRALYPWLQKQCTISDEPFLDVRLWNRCPMSHRVADPWDVGKSAHRSVGIKGMPGRTGYGGGHRGRDRSAVSDLDQRKLRSLIGADADAYARFYDPKVAALPPEKNGHIAVRHVANIAMSKNIAHSEAGRVHGPNWLQWLAEFKGKPNLVAGEIGTFEGDSAEWFLDNVITDPTSKFHAIDPFTGSIEHRVGNINTSRLEETARAKLARFSNVEIHKGYSQDVLRSFKDKLDFIYVDGAHDARSVLRDAVLAFDLLKPGGVMIFDDYSWSVFPNELDRPKGAVDAFARLYSKHLDVIQGKGAQFVVRKKNDD